jgi:hypothetical protein
LFNQSVVLTTNNPVNPLNPLKSRFRQWLQIMKKEGFDESKEIGLDEIRE